MQRTKMLLLAVLAVTLSSMPVFATIPLGVARPAQNIEINSVKLKAFIMDRGSNDSEYRFCYWKSDGVKNQTPWTMPNVYPLDATCIVSDQVKGLAIGTPYTYRVEFQNSDGHYYSGTKTFNTKARLTISSGNGGSVTTPGEGVFESIYNSTITVEATPNEAFVFTHWSGSAVDAGLVADATAAATSVKAIGDQTLIANFEEKHSEIDGLAVMEAELFEENIAQGEAEWVLQGEQPGASRCKYMRALPTSATRVGEDPTGISPRLDYLVYFRQTGTYYVWARAISTTPGGDDNSIHMGLNGEFLVDRMDIPTNAQWTWVNDGGASVEISETGFNTVNVWMREAGCRVDKLLLTTDPNYIPEGYGPRDPLLEPAVSITPSADLVATGDQGAILSISGNDVNDLILGTTVFVDPPKYPSQPPEDADNFDLGSAASADDQPYIEVFFDLPVTTIFMAEKGGNDEGMMIGLDRDGVPIDEPTPFYKSDNFGFPQKEDSTNLKVHGNQNCGLAVITPECGAIWGLGILPSEGQLLGIDPTSISGIPGPVITVKPISDLDATSAENDPNTLTEVLGINGFSTNDLILGETTADFQKHPQYLTTDGDNFDLTTKASHDDATWVETMFPVPVTQIFIMEVGANDTGLFQPIDADGNPLGAPIMFTPEDMQFQDEGLKIMGQKAGGMVIEAIIPMAGLRILPAPGITMGIDPASVSGLPIPVITKAAVDTVTADPNAVIESINGIAAADLILGSTIAHEDLARAANADNLDLSQQDCSRAKNEAEQRRWVITTFAEPVSQIFVMEMAGSNGEADDDGWVIPLDINGNPIGGRLWYQPGDWGIFTIPGARNDRNVAGLVFTPETDVPVYGLQHWSDGVDILSISGVRMPPAPLAQWSFDEGAGAVANDSSGHGYHGDIMGDPTWVDGVLGTALDFDGDGDYVACGSEEIFQLREALSVSVWINIRSVPGSWRAIITKGDNTWRVATHKATNRIDFGWGTGAQGWPSVKTSSEATPGEWNHVAVTFDATDGGYIYLNGVLEDYKAYTEPIPESEVDYEVMIGENNQASGRFFDGLIDEVTVYEVALTSHEIADIAGL